jgi:hypothetical protein
MGRGTYIDIPWHVDAATRILKLRFFHDPSIVISRPFDRLAVESVMYQVFLVTTGCWSEDPVHVHYQFDPQFWLQCERLLARSNMFPDQPGSCNSPVLGVPCALFKLILTIKKMYDSQLQNDPETLQHLRNEVAYWETAMALREEHTNSQPSICDDATFLYILISSLLVEQLADMDLTSGKRIPQPVPTSRWQLQEMADILRRRRGDCHWERCFVANWPVYTVGFFMSSPDGIGLVREEMERRWALSSFAQVSRFSRDLENTWARRHMPMDTDEEEQH